MKSRWSCDSALTAPAMATTSSGRPHFVPLTETPPDRLRSVIDAYRDAGGEGTLILQVHVSWAPTGQEALEIARDQWRTNVFPPPVCWDLTPAHLDAVSRFVTDEQLRESVVIGSDLGELTERIRALVDLGFDEVYLHHVGQSQAAFIEAFGAHVVPQLR